MYTPNVLESGSDTVIKWVRFCWSLSYYTSPLLAAFLYRRGYFSMDGAYWLARMVGNISSVLILSYLLRGLGRYRNDDYMRFMDILAAAQKAGDGPVPPDIKKLLAVYDFEFSAWPVDFAWHQVEEAKTTARAETSLKSPHHRSTRLTTMPCNLLSYIFAHTIGLGMVYPGATLLINTLIAPALLEGRIKLYEERNGRRAKLLSRDGSEIDTMFVDNRERAGANGQYLVVCCEGNSGFYEVGCMGTPMEADYSVLGWNHPGFGGSTGRPWPQQEQNAIDVVLQYAIHGLGFPVENVIIFAWSIGAYPASWAAMNYPDLRYVVLDATFDDLLPLAVGRMPQSVKSLVTLTVRRYLNLNIAEQIVHYPGPVLLIRRYRDEMISTVDAFTPSSNRGNDLMIKLLQYRYPRIIDETRLALLRRWCSGSTVTHDALLTEFDVDAVICQRAMRSSSEPFPSQIGADFDDETKSKFALFLVSRYMIDFDTHHCDPLPARLFTKPWRPDDVIEPNDVIKDTVPPTDYLA